MTLLQQYQQKKREARKNAEAQHQVNILKERASLLSWLAESPASTVQGGLYQENADFMLAEGFTVVKIGPSLYAISIPDEE